MISVEITIDHVPAPNTATVSRLIDVLGSLIEGINRVIEDVIAAA
jgi:hypothetical protein